MGKRQERRMKKTWMKIWRMSRTLRLMRER
jgi:hypothetical protein